MGFNIDSDAVQENLDFEERESELFAGKEMGEDVRRLVGKYKDRTLALHATVASSRHEQDFPRQAQQNIFKEQIPQLLLIMKSLYFIKTKLKDKDH